MAIARRTLKLSLVAGLLASFVPPAQAQGPAAPVPGAAQQAELAVAGNRAGAVQTIASRWQGQLGNAGAQAQFVATLEAATNAQLARLLSAGSLQDVRAILLGNLAAQAGGNGVMALGDSTQDLVFTPNNPPCRVFDTRFIGAGTAPAAASTSSYQVYGNAATMTAQGGNPAGCAAPKGEPVAVSANFTAVPVGFQGHIRVFPFGGSLPTVSFVNFNGVVGNNIANSGIVSTCYICAFDLSVYNGSQTHHIGDVMGYFYPATFGNIDLPNSTASTGNILKNGAPFIHNYGTGNTFIGENAGNLTMTGSQNTASGLQALFSNTTGTFNTASGIQALLSNTTGFQNTASGVQALASNTSGSFNTASGLRALYSNTEGDSNTASGVNALFSNTSGGYNTASGYQALTGNTTGFFNTAIGYVALLSNTTGNANTASGVQALRDNTIGGGNTASGAAAMSSNTTGSGNTANGSSALFDNTTGLENTAIGSSALSNNTTGGHNTASGVQSLLFNTTGSFNIGVGINAGYYQTTGSANIYVGNEGVAGESNTIRIGTGGMAIGYTHNRLFAVGIRGVTTGVANAIPVVVDSSGQLGTASSSRHVKADIADMGEASSVLMDLRPVTFRYTIHGDDPTVQYGLIAEEVAETAPGLVARSASGEAETVYYQHLAPMLLNEYQKQQRTIQVQAEEIAVLKREAARSSELRQQAARIAELERQVSRMGELERQTAHMAQQLERLGRVEVAAGR